MRNTLIFLLFALIIVKPCFAESVVDETIVDNCLSDFDVNSIDKESSLYDRRDFFQWPSFEKINQFQRTPNRTKLEEFDKHYEPLWINIRKVPLEKAYPMAKLWIQYVLQEKNCPQEMYERFIALDGENGKPDTICIQYQTPSDDCIQITQTPSQVFIVYRPKDQFQFQSDRDEDYDSQLKIYANEKIYDLFNERDSLRKAYGLVSPQKGDRTIFLERNTKIYFSSFNKANQTWWGKMTWWTDGNTFTFYITKRNAESPLHIPYHVKEWF